VWDLNYIKLYDGFQSLKCVGLANDLLNLGTIAGLWGVPEEEKGVVSAV